MPPSRTNKTKQEETYATKNLSNLYFFGPKPTKGEDVNFDFGEFLKLPGQEELEPVGWCDFSKPFFTPYNDERAPLPKVDEQLKKKYREEAIFIGDADTEGPVKDYDLPNKMSLWEHRVVQISNAVRNKPNWQNKINDTTIVQKWISELSTHYATHVEMPAVDTSLMTYALDELKFLASLGNENCEVSSITGVWQSDSLVPEELVVALRRGVAILEDVPNHQKDWHPDSGSMVLDLVHPSLFCWINGVTPLYHTKEQSCKRYYVDIKPERDFTRSLTCQWLPSEFEVNDKDINNLEPNKHKGLYGTIAKIFERFLPLFQHVLSDLATSKPRHWWDQEVYKRIPYYQAEQELERWLEEHGEDEGDEEEEEEEEDGEAPAAKKMKLEEKRKEKEDGKPKKVMEPEAPEISFEKYDLQECSLAGRRLQVIVKLANIELTPESPSYPGGAWHVEGMRNEENITESILNFRRAAQLDFGEYDEEGTTTRGVQEVYGVSNGVALNDELGGLVTKEGRAIAFPNLFQHQVAPFQLVDKTKKGVRKILVFFLIDPNHRVLSTSVVPPQNMAWALKELAVLFHQLPKYCLVPPFDDYAISKAAQRRADEGTKAVRDDQLLIRV